MNEPARNARRWRRRLPRVLAVGLALSAAAESEEPEGDPFAEERQVTAVDVVVEIESGRGKGRAPRGLGPDDFEVMVGGEPRPVVAVVDPRGTAEVDRWQVVVYFDLATARSATVRWAALELRERLDELLRLGEVEVVVADPEPTEILAATDDRGLVADALARLAVEGGGREVPIVLRAQFLTALAQVPGDRASAEELGRGLAAEEEWSLSQGLDELLFYLTGHPTGTSRRVLFYVSDGFDLRPSAFYRARGAGDPGRPAAAEPAADDGLGDRLQAMAEALGAYGWVVISLTPPEPDAGLVPGFRLGKWRFDRVGPSRIGIAVHAVREDRREPERADGFIELGEVYFARGDLDEAIEAFELALYHFAGDPRTATRQAVAKAGLGHALAAVEEPAGAAKAFRDAVELDPSYRARLPLAEAAFASPLEPLELLVGATAGHLVADREALAETIESLGRRLRLTYQVAGPPSGELAALEVVLRSPGPSLLAPGRMRFGTPAEVAAARARRLLASDDLDAGELPVGLVHGDSELTVMVDRPATPEDGLGVLRVTVARGHPGAVAGVRHLRVAGPHAAADARWSRAASLPPPGDDEIVAVVVEDLATGRWGGALF